MIREIRGKSTESQERKLPRFSFSPSGWNVENLVFVAFDDITLISGGRANLLVAVGHSSLLSGKFMFHYPFFLWLVLAGKEGFTGGG